MERAVEHDDAPELRDRLAALAAYGPKLETSGATFGVWVSSAGSLPYVELSPLGTAFCRTCGQHGWLLTNFEWPLWSATDECTRLREDHEAIAAATPDQLAHLLTTLIRRDQFMEGTLLNAFESGLIGRIVKRASALLLASYDA